MCEFWMLTVRALLMMDTQTIQPFKGEGFSDWAHRVICLFFFYFGSLRYVIHLHVLCDHSVALI